MKLTTEEWAQRQLAAIFGVVEARRLFKSDRPTMLAVCAVMYAVSAGKA